MFLRGRSAVSLQCHTVRGEDEVTPTVQTAAAPAGLAPCPCNWLTLTGLQTGFSCFCSEWLEMYSKQVPPFLGFHVRWVRLGEACGWLTCSPEPEPAHPSAAGSFWLARLPRAYGCRHPHFLALEQEKPGSRVRHAALSRLGSPPFQVVIWTPAQGCSSGCWCGGGFAGWASGSDVWVWAEPRSLGVCFMSLSVRLLGRASSAWTRAPPVSSAHMHAHTCTHAHSCTSMHAHSGIKIGGRADGQAPSSTPLGP